MRTPGDAGNRGHDEGQRGRGARGRTANRGQENRGQSDRGQESSGQGNREQGNRDQGNRGPGNLGQGNRGQGNRRQGGGGRGQPDDAQHPGSKLPERLENLPYVTPTMIAQLGRAGVHSPNDLRGRSGDQLYASIQRSYGEQPQHTVLYVLRAIAHFVRTGERKDWREFMDIGHKRRPPERSQRPPGPFGTHPRGSPSSTLGSGRRPPRSRP